MSNIPQFCWLNTSVCLSNPVDQEEQPKENIIVAVIQMLIACYWGEEDLGGGCQGTHHLPPEMTAFNYVVY